MSRVAWVLLVFLIFTNVVWFISRDSDQGLFFPTKPTETAGKRKDPDISLHLGNVLGPDGAVTLPKGAIPPGPVTPGQSDHLRRTWTRAVRDSSDPAAQRTAIEQIYEAVVGGDRSRSLAGLRTLPWIQTANYDKRAFKPHVEARMISPDPRIRQAAIIAFSTLDIGRADVDQLLQLVHDQDRDVRKEIPRAMLAANGFQAEGIVGSTMVELLHDDDLAVQLAVLRALETSHLMDPEVEMELIPLVESDNELLALRALSALAGTKLKKNAQVIGILAANLGHQDPKFRTEARQGLSQGVSAGHGSQIADMITPLLGAQAELGDQQGNVQLLAEYGTGVHIDALENLSQDSSVPELVRRSAREAIEKIESRRHQ